MGGPRVCKSALLWGHFGLFGAGMSNPLDYVSPGPSGHEEPHSRTCLRTVGVRMQPGSMHTAQAKIITNMMMIRYS